MLYGSFLSSPWGKKMNKVEKPSLIVNLIIQSARRKQAIIYLFCVTVHYAPHVFQQLAMRTLSGEAGEGADQNVGQNGTACAINVECVDEQQGSKDGRKLSYSHIYYF